MTTERHPATEHMLGCFSYEHLDGIKRDIAATLAGLATKMADQLPDSPELTVGLRKLLEAEDCFVRASLTKTEKENA